MPTTKIMVTPTQGDPYPVRVGTGILKRLGRYLRELPQLQKTGHVLVISDKNVAPLYGDVCKTALATEGFVPKLISVEPGEASKSPAVLAELWNACAQLGVTRDWCVVALGGGVVGDLSGFLAATWMRGIPVVQVPTSLIAMVDAAVGGKTAIDLPAGKNLVGAFWQPLSVVADVSTLATLPANDWLGGLGEVAKTAMVTDDDSVFWLMDAAPALGEGVKRAKLAASRTPAAFVDPDVVAEMVARAVVAKADLVGVDPLDTLGIRAGLNYGHTLGHALESCAPEPLNHGIAVTMGMRVAGELSVARAGLNSEVLEAQNRLLDAMGLTLSKWPVSAVKFVSDDTLMEAMRRDKKNVSPAGNVSGDCDADAAGAGNAAGVRPDAGAGATDGVAKISHVPLVLLEDVGAYRLADVEIKEILSVYHKIVD